MHLFQHCHLISFTSLIVQYYLSPHCSVYITDVPANKMSKTKLQATTTTINQEKETVHTEKFLSTLVHAATYGSHTILSLSDTARSGHIQFKEEGDARSALTIADTSAQRIIVSSILGSYPNLHIVGEEDESVEVDVAYQRVLRDDILVGHEWTTANVEKEQPPEYLNLAEVTVFVDPLDGTREFVEGRLSNVQSLIGVCYKGRPLMGAIGLPFPNEANGNSTEVVFGIIGKGIGKVCTKKDESENDIVTCAVPDVKQYQEGDTIFLSSGDSASVRSAVDLAHTIFEAKGGIQQQVVGATGNKLIKVAQGSTVLSLLHTKTSLWDTAAPAAILESMGGHVTDYFGEPLVYNTKELGNKMGVVASAYGAKGEHDVLVKAMRGSKSILSILSGLNCNFEGSQCVDITRDLDGYLLSNEYFECIAKTESYHAPEDESVRGLMSNACRVHLQPSGDTVFYKRIVFEHLEHAREKMKTAPHKLVRDVNSYKVETSFLASKACQQVVEKAGLRIPKCYAAQLAPNEDNPIESKFSVLLEDFSPSDGWSQRWLLQSEDEAKFTLTTLAKMHAFFWNGSAFWDDKDAAAELENGVWDSASYVQPKLQTLNQCKDVAKGWATSKLKCKKELESFDFWNNLGERLESVAEENGRLAHPFAVDELSETFKQYRTFTHGDPKQANLFFRQSSGSNLEVGLIDFQWSGFGLASTDIAHFLTAAAHADLLNDGGESKLLEYYYTELSKYLVEYGAYSNIDVKEHFSFDTFIDQYETAVLDMCRLVIAYAWSRFEPIDKNDKAGCARTANKNSYNKSMPNVIWLMSRCDEILKSRGV